MEELIMQSMIGSEWSELRRGAVPKLAEGAPLLRV